MASVATETLPFAEPLAGRFAGLPPASSPVLARPGRLRPARRRIPRPDRPLSLRLLALKYRGTATPHERMMPAPITPDELGPIDLVRCTHHHTDHLDAATPRPARRPAAGAALRRSGRIGGARDDTASASARTG